MEINNYLNNFPVELHSNEVYGRFLVASKDLKAGEIIMKDVPVLVGPTAYSDLMCLGCYMPLSKKLHICSKCALAPLCGSRCEDYSGGHSATECVFFRSIKNKMSFPTLVESFHIITILRAIALRMNHTDKSWNSFINLESHMEKRRGLSIWNLHENTSKMLQNLQIICQEDVDDELIQKIAGVIDVNSFELRTAHSQANQSKNNTICGIYPMAAFMTHNCVGNTHVGIDKSFNMIIRASVPISKNSPIFFNYTNALQGTIQRKEHLREGKYFECACQRCSDGSELGLHMSSIKCFNCNDGLIVMQNPLRKSQFSPKDMWCCQKCNDVFPGKQIKECLDGLHRSIENIDIGANNIKKIEDFLVAALERLPKYHHILIDAKHLLAGLLREITDRLINVPKNTIKRKLELCEEFIPLLDILEPGISRLKAITLYEIHSAMVQIANKEHEAKEISFNELLIKLEKAEKFLRDSIRFLLFEPKSSPEGVLCRRAMEDLRVLINTKKSIRNLNVVEVNTVKI